VPGRSFNPEEFLPARLFTTITNLRVDDPDVAFRTAAMRVRRRRLSPDGKFTLLAADHPARMVTEIRMDQLRMGDRHEFLSRVARVLACSPFDGVLGTADVFDDLLMLEHLVGGRRSFLGRKLMLGSVNRGGLAGTVFELDDQATGYDVDGIARMRLDGAKFLLRVDPDDEASARTLWYGVKTVRECSKLRLPVFVEPLPVVKRDGKVKADNTKEKLVKLVGVASALGSSSARVWLKLPYCNGFEDVAAATTLPIVLLGGEAGDDVPGLLNEVEAAMKAGPNVRGVLLGRNLLYPPGDDPLPLAMALHSMVHEGAGAAEAAKSMAKWEEKDLDCFRLQRLK
jgi:DhnA family fructose-bisphosphate aldolase class Ia